MKYYIAHIKTKEGKIYLFSEGLMISKKALIQNIKNWFDDINNNFSYKITTIKINEKALFSNKKLKRK